MNWIKQASSVRFEELKEVAKDWVKDADQEFIEEVGKAETIMELKKAFEGWGFKSTFEGMMMEFFEQENEMKKEGYAKAEWKKIEKLAKQKGTKFTSEQAKAFVKEIGNLRFEIQDLKETIQSITGEGSDNQEAL